MTYAVIFKNIDTFEEACVKFSNQFAKHKYDQYVEHDQTEYRGNLSNVMTHLFILYGFLSFSFIHPTYLRR